AGVLRACIDPERGGEKESPPGTSFPRGFALARPGGVEPPTSGFVVLAAASPGFTVVPKSRMAVLFASPFQRKNHGVPPPARSRAATLCNMTLRPGPAARHVRGLRQRVAAAARIPSAAATVQEQSAEQEWRSPHPPTNCSAAESGSRLLRPAAPIAPDVRP